MSYMTKLVVGIEDLDGIPDLDKGTDELCEAYAELMNSDPIAGITGNDIDAAIAFGTKDTPEEISGMDSEEYDEDDDVDDDEDTFVTKNNGGSAYAADTAADVSFRINIFDSYREKKGEDE